MGVSEKQRFVLPGDAIAVVEEFIPGNNVYESDGTIRALLPGAVVKNMQKMEIGVKPSAIAKMPVVGDVVTGQIEVAQTSTANLRIYYLNGSPTTGGFAGTIFTREDRGRGPRRTQVRLGDVVRAKVVSTTNGMFHLSISESHLGVIGALCSVCGHPLSGGGGRVRCEQCGSVEDRKLADDFGREPVEP